VSQYPKSRHSKLKPRQTLDASSKIILRYCLPQTQWLSFTSSLPQALEVLFVSAPAAFSHQQPASQCDATPAVHCAGEVSLQPAFLSPSITVLGICMIFTSTNPVTNASELVPKVAQEAVNRFLQVRCARWAYGPLSFVKRVLLWKLLGSGSHRKVSSLKEGLRASLAAMKKSWCRGKERMQPSQGTKGRRKCSVQLTGTCLQRRSPLATHEVSG